MVEGVCMYATMGLSLVQHDDRKNTVEERKAGGERERETHIHKHKKLIRWKR